MINEKIYSSANDLLLAVEDWKQHGFTIVFTNGCFDILHPGHIDYLEKASKLGDKLIVALNSDASVSKLKGKHRPLQSQDARTRIMAALSMVDAVVIFGEDTPLEIISLLKPDVLVKGGDYKINEIVGSDIVRENGGRVYSLEFLEGYSTSAIEKKIKES